jgi:hypothetical protein
MARKKKTEWPKVTKGSHLTVYTFEDGKTELVWDDEALLSEVRNAILKSESILPASKKSKKFNYSEPKEIINDDDSKSLQITVTKKPVAKKAPAKKTTKGKTK